MSLENELKSLIVNELKLAHIKPEEIEDETPLFADGLGLDSLDAVEIVVLLQKHYKVMMKEADRAAFSSIKTLADYIRNHRS